MARKTIEKNIAFDNEKKRYYVTMDYGKDESGKRIKKCQTYKTKTQARKALKKFELDKLNNTLVMPTGDTVQTWLNYWLDSLKAIRDSDTTIYGYTNIINKHLIPYMGNIALQKLSAHDINEYMAYKAKNGLSNSTIHKHYDLLKDALKNAVLEDKIAKNPMDKVNPPKVIKSEMNCYTAEQLQKLFEIIKDDRMEVPIKLAGYLGLRREEICGLKWNCIDFEKNDIYIKCARTQAGSKIIEKETKTDSSNRKLHMPDDLVAVLKCEKAKQEKNKEVLKKAYIDSGFVVAWETGKPYRPNYISELFKKIIDDNHLSPIRFHDLRHSFASIGNASGATMFEISKSLGHSQMSTTAKIYAHEFDKNHENVIDNVANAINSNKKKEITTNSTK